MNKKQNNLMRFSRTERLAQLSEQEIVIERKKREIQAKLEAQKKKQTEETLRKFKETKSNKPEFSKKSSWSGSENQESKDKNPTERPVKESLTNAFSNDGSFLDHFKKLSQTGLPVNTDDLQALAKQNLEKDSFGEVECKEGSKTGDPLPDRDYKPFVDNSQPNIREPLESNIQFQIPPPGVVQLLPQNDNNSVTQSAFHSSSSMVSSHSVSVPQGYKQNSVPAFNSKNIQSNPFQGNKVQPVPPIHFSQVAIMKNDYQSSVELGQKSFSRTSVSPQPPHPRIPPSELPKYRSESISLTLKTNTAKKLEAIPNPLGTDQESSPPSPKRNQSSPKGMMESCKESFLNTTSMVENVSSDNRESLRISSAFKNDTESKGERDEVDEKYHYWAELVARYGDDFEESLRTRNQNDPSIEFLFNQNSKEYLSFRKLVLSYRNHLGPSNNEPLEKIQKLNSPESCNERSAEEGFSIDNRNNDEKRKRKRKSRWGDIAASTSTPTVAGVALQSKLPAPKSTLLSQLTRSDPGLIQYARQTFGSTNLSEEDWKKAEDHYKINLLYQDMVKKKAEVEKLEKQGKFKYEYDSDEDTEGGTWEHKLRQQEMQATQLWAEELTRQAAGKHHIGDFLPPEELERFMEKYNAVKEGREPDLSDYKEFKLKEDNVGYRLLQKMGWNEGQGLGQDGSGITNPVNKATTRHENQGLGVDRPDGLEAGDDEYDAYRKRMMLAYRFRPNPLNNPRRPYY